MTQRAKTAAAQKALEFVKPGMILGLGSGSTAEIFIQLLPPRKLKAVASSRASFELAKKGGLELVDINSISHIDLTIDGADEVDPQKRMIKGAGGAHVREKILASSSKETIIIVDESKLVPSLGHRKLPVEVLFYGSPATRSKIERLGYTGTFRQNSDETLFVTENGNVLFDIAFNAPLKNPEEVHEALRRIPGVIDTGFFFNLAGKVIVGYPDGKTKIF